MRDVKIKLTWRNKMTRLAALVAGLTTLGIATLSSTVQASPLTNSVNSDSNNAPRIQSVDPNLTPDFDSNTYILRWKDGGVRHYGKLVMYNNKRGKLRVYTNVLDQPVTQDIALRRNRNSFILQGYNSTHPNYSADRFRFQLGNSASDISRLEHCSTGPCVPIRFQKY